VTGILWGVGEGVGFWVLWGWGKGLGSGYLISTVVAGNGGDG
jgi:hypothetical protein